MYKRQEHWDDDDEVAAYLAKIVNKQAFDKTGLIYGMGHAVYTKSDPVSYTHLDVYKRQPLAFANLPLISS